MANLICYCRVSSKSQGKSGLGLQAQEDAVMKFAKDNGHTVLKVVHEVASGGLSVNDRPALKEALAEAKKIGAMLIVNKVCRLARRVSVVAGLMDLNIKFIISELGETVDAMFIQMLSIFAERERKIIGERTKAALKVLKDRGVKLGNLDSIDKARKLSNVANASKADEFANKMKTSIQRMLSSGMSMRAIAAEFNENGTKTARNGCWTAKTVANIIERF